MEANKLMVDDWVLWKGKPVQVASVSGVKYSFGQIDVTLAHCNDKKILETHDIKSIQPIPLTPEILEKNGFITEEREGDPTFPYLAFIIENDEYRVEITWYDSHDVYEPNTGEYLHGAPEVWNMEILGKCSTYYCSKNKLYLHELQHALKLCGIEKNIII
jgi:hypothetical protein